MTLQDSLDILAERGMSYDDDTFRGALAFVAQALDKAGLLDPPPLPERRDFGIPAEPFPNDRRRIVQGNQEVPRG